MTKSYVTMEQQVCLICTKTFDSGTLLIDRRLRETFETYTTTGWGLCPEHEKLHKDGFIALVGVDPERGGTSDPNKVYRTGTIVHLKCSVWDNIFSTPLPTADGEPVPLAFTSDEVLEHLISLQGEQND